MGLEARVHQKRARGCDAWDENVREWYEHLLFTHQPSNLIHLFLSLLLSPSPFIKIISYYSGWAMPLLYRMEMHSSRKNRSEACLSPISLKTAITSRTSVLPIAAGGDSLALEVRTRWTGVLLPEAPHNHANRQLI